MKNAISIETEKEYHKMIVEIHEIMKKGETHLTASEVEQLKKMALLVEKYEDDVLKLKPAKQSKST